jgi:hypothetical protein
LVETPLVIFGVGSGRFPNPIASAKTTYSPVTKDEQVEKEFELRRLHEGANPFESEEELSDRIAELEADLAGLVPITF